MTFPIPEWLDEYLDRVRDALGMQVWEIRPWLVLAPDENNQAVDARCFPNSAYLSAEIHFRHALFQEPSAGAKVLVIHELLHVLECEQDCFTEQAIRSFVPQKHHEFLEAQLSEARERRIVRLSRQLYRMLEAAGEFDAGAPNPKASAGLLVTAQKSILMSTGEPALNGAKGVPA